MNPEVFIELGWQAWLTLGVLASMFGLLVFTRLPPDFLFMGGLGVLFVSGVLTEKEAFNGFAAQGMITVAVLYVVVAGLQGTGGLNWIVQHVLGKPKTVAGAQLRMMLPVTGLSAFLNNTPVAAMFIPVVKKWSRGLKINASQLMIPLSYASIFGGVCTLIGTSTNIVVNGLYQSRYGEGLTIFGITKLGVPCLLVGLIYLLLFSRRLLPDRKGADVAFGDPHKYMLEMMVDPNGTVAGKSIASAGLRHLQSGFLTEIVRENQILSAPNPSEVLHPDDRLIFSGAAGLIQELRDRSGLRVAEDELFKLDAPLKERCLVECVVSNTCPLLGRTIRAGNFRSRYNAVVLAVARNGARLTEKTGDIKLRAGDTLLVESHAGFIPRQKDSRDFYLISEIEDSAPLETKKAPLAFLFLIAMVFSAAMGWLSMLMAAMCAAAGMLVFGCCSFSRARRSIEWNVLIVIAAALGLGRAMDKTGAATAIADGMLSLCGDSPWGALALVFLTTSFFTEVITNNAAAALIFPVAMTTAERLAVNPLPFVFCLMVAASCSFSTPIGYQTNLMVYGPGGYRFSDYFKIGLPLNFIIFLVAVGLAPLLWPF